MDAVMMVRAQHDAVADVGAAAMTLPPPDVMRLRVRWRPVARRPGATAVTLDQSQLLRGREESGRAAELERRFDLSGIAEFELTADWTSPP